MYNRVQCGAILFFQTWFYFNSTFFTWFSCNSIFFFFFQTWLCNSFFFFFFQTWFSVIHFFLFFQTWFYLAVGMLLVFGMMALMHRGSSLVQFARWARSEQRTFSSSLFTRLNIMKGRTDLEWPHALHLLFHKSKQNYYYFHFYNHLMYPMIYYFYFFCVRGSAVRRTSKGGVATSIERSAQWTLSALFSQGILGSAGHVCPFVGFGYKYSISDLCSDGLVRCGG